MLAVDRTFLFHALALGDIARYAADAGDRSALVAIDAGMAKHVHDLAGDVPDGQGIIADLPLVEHLPIGRAGFFGLGEVTGEVRSDEAGAGHAGGFLSGVIEVGDLALRADGHERVEAASSRLREYKELPNSFSSVR